MHMTLPQCMTDTLELPLCLVGAGQQQWITCGIVAVVIQQTASHLITKAQKQHLAVC